MRRSGGYCGLAGGSGAFCSVVYSFVFDECQHMYTTIYISLVKKYYQ